MCGRREPRSIAPRPTPEHLKGVAKATAARITGSRPEVLIDKLGERLAFERTGIRLYEAMIMTVSSLQRLSEVGRLGQRPG